MDSDVRAMRVAARQWGALNHRQALAAGLTSDQIAYRLRVARWRLVAHSVYVVAGAPGRWEQTTMIACLAGPVGTVVSHLSAAALFGLTARPSAPHVTIPPGCSGRFGAAKVFRGRFSPGETCERDRIPCTTPIRTIIDCAAAGLIEGEDLWNLVDRALCRKLVRPARLIEASRGAWAASRGRRRGRLAALERALDVWRSGAPAGSPPEARLQRKLIEWGFPRPERQIEVFDEKGKFVARADVGIREWKVLFEYDSDEHHGPRCWIADDERKERIEALGYILVPVDRFDLRPSSTRLRDRLDEIRCARSAAMVAVERACDAA